MFQDKSILGLICARGGSKGVPKKNIRELGGIPLIGWSIRIGKQCPCIDRFIVSTDSEEIAAAARSEGAEVPFLRPVELGRDDSPEWLSWQHALKSMSEQEGFRADYLLVLPPTSPFRAVEDIEKALHLLHSTPADIIISVTDAGRNPYFNMVEITPSGEAHLCKNPPDRITRRQDAPKVYDMTTVLYAARSEFVLKSRNTFDGKVKILEVPEIRALDIDTEMDLAFAEFLITKGMIGKDENRL